LSFSEESIEYPKLEMPSGNTLMDLLDGVMLLYHIAAHKQLGKVGYTFTKLFAQVLLKA